MFSSSRSPPSVEKIAPLLGPHEPGWDQRAAAWFLLVRLVSPQSWDCRKAELAAHDYGVKAIWNLVDHLGVHEATRRGAREPHVVFAIGLGPFDTPTGLSCKHSQFEKRLVPRVRSMDYSVHRGKMSFGYCVKIIKTLKGDGERQRNNMAHHLHHERYGL